MTKVKDVVRMKVPFPSIQDNLAVRPHMYVCIEDGGNKRFLSCQTKKPSMLSKNKPPFIYIDEAKDITRNPFDHPTLISCDYAFGIGNIHVNSKLLATNRKDVCQELYEEICQTIQHSSFHTKPINKANLLSINGLLQKRPTVS